ncbi:hypothetical protein CO614_02130 [Lysobacteraceae bacterium NML120232]|nr:hypothetical protein CO614_02130 [Xanthomonadaceae bacterium NML120232]
MKYLKHWAIWPTLALLAGLIAGWALPPPPLPKAEPEADGWVFGETLNLARNSSAGKEAAAGNIWLGQPDPSSAANGPKPWRLAGIASGPVALVELTESSTVERIHLGEKLPDGATLVAVGSHHIEVEDKQCRMTYMMLAKDPTRKVGEGCPKEEAPSDEQPSSSETTK